MMVTMTSLAEPTLDTSIESLEELFSSPAYKEDKGYRIIFWDDDVTPMQYVEAVLRDVFEHDPATAEVLMLRVHNEGKGEVYTGEYEECMKRQNAVKLLNTLLGQNLVSTVEKVE